MPINRPASLTRLVILGVTWAAFARAVRRRSLRAPMPAASYHVTSLPNGLRVATAEMPACESISVGLWAGVGGRHETIRTNGAAHFLEHLLFKGTQRRTPAAITREVEGLGGDLNAFTSEDHTCYFAKADARRLDRVADVLLDMYAHSTLPAAEVERERGVIREEILMGKDQPSQVAEELLAEEFWPGHALGRPLTGTEKSLAGITRDDLLTFWRAHYGGRNTVFTVAGPVVHAEVLRSLGPALGRLPAGRRAPRAKAPAGFGLPGVRGRGKPRGRHGIRVALDRQDSEQVQLAVGFPAPHRWDPRRFAARTLNVLLGDNMSSRLFQLLRERRGLCYSVQTSADSFQDSGIFGIYVGLEAGRVVETLRLVGRELRRIADHSPSAAEMRRARDYLVGQHRIALDEGTTSQMNWMGECLLAYGRVAEPAEAREKLAAVTADEVRALAHAAFVESGHGALAAVGPLENSPEELRAALAGPLAR